MLKARRRPGGKQRACSCKNDSKHFIDVDHLAAFNLRLNNGEDFPTGANHRMQEPGCEEISAACIVDPDMQHNDRRRCSEED